MPPASWAATLADASRGAALLAARSITGRWPSSAAPGAAARPLAEPDHGRAAAWDALWAGYEHAREAVTRHYDGATPPEPRS